MRMWVMKEIPLHLSRSCHVNSVLTLSVRPTTGLAYDMQLNSLFKRGLGKMTNKEKREPVCK